jgi:hypothetical protein
MTQIVNDKKDTEAVRKRLEEITGGKVPDFWKKIFPDKGKSDGEKKRADVDS